MGRTGTIFVAICMAIIALSSATVLIFQFGRPFGEAVSLSLALMCTMILIHLLVGRARDRGAVSETVAEVPLWIPEGVMLVGLAVFWLHLVIYLLRVLVGLPLIREGTGEE